MQRDINKVILTGRLVKDPKLYEAGGDSVYALLRVAINAGRDRGGNDRPALFYDIKVWNAEGRSCVEFLGKGSRVAVDGRLGQYTPEGESREWNHVIASSVGFLDERREAAGGGVDDRFAAAPAGEEAEVFA